MVLGGSGLAGDMQVAVPDALPPTVPVIVPLAVSLLVPSAWTTSLNVLEKVPVTVPVLTVEPIAV
jgi:hypothetical protein